MEVNNIDENNFRERFNLSVFLITEMGRPFLSYNVVQYEIEKRLWYLFYKEKNVYTFLSFIKTRYEKFYEHMLV
jgi:hypothetical protein